MADSRLEPVESPDKTTIFGYHDLDQPTPKDIYDARQTVKQHLPRTPLVRSESLSETLSADVYLKREDTLPTGSFKIRGFYTLLESLEDVFLEKGVLTASMGNHGQAMAYAARDLDIPATIVVPKTLENPGKVRAMEQMGATVRKEGADFDEAREFAETLATREPYRYVHGGNESPLIAGRASAGLEVMEDLPHVDTLINPVGGGSSAAAYALTVGNLLGASVIGVQSTEADAVYRAWVDGEIQILDSADTIAEGLATRTPFALPLEILRSSLEDFLLVPDTAISESMYRLLSEESILAEGAGATGVAGALQLEEKLVDQTVVIPISGRNIAEEKLHRVLEAHSS